MCQEYQITTEDRRDQLLGFALLDLEQMDSTQLAVMRQKITEMLIERRRARLNGRAATMSDAELDAVGF